MKLHHLNIIHVKDPFLVVGFMKPNWFTPNILAIFKRDKRSAVSQSLLETLLTLKILFHKLRVIFFLKDIIGK